MNFEIKIGEYDYKFEDGKQTIKRNGEPWRDETGDNFILLMAQELYDLRTNNEKTQDLNRIRSKYGI